MINTTEASFQATKTLRDNVSVASIFTELLEQKGLLYYSVPRWLNVLVVVNLHLARDPSIV